MADLKSAGDVEIRQLIIATSSGPSLDIRNQAMSINIYEDIFSPFITGTILVQDSLDFVNYFPLIGDETLYLTISTPGFKDKGTYIDGVFRIFKLSDREMMGNRSVGYILHFISSEAVIDLNTKISKAFNDDIAYLAIDILSNHLKIDTQIGRYNIEPTLNSLSYVSNLWSPIKNLNYLAENATTMSGSPTFLFFENRVGLNFMSLEALYKNESVRTFTYNNFIRDLDGPSDSIRNIERDYSKIINIIIPTAYDYIERMRSGTFSSALITHNITTKSYNEVPFDFLVDYSKDVRLNKYPLITPSALHSTAAAIAVMHKSSAVLPGTSDITNSKIFQKRRSLLALAESSKVEITVFGRTDYTVGQKVYLDLARNMPIEKMDRDTQDHMFSGYYIISSLRHSIEHSQHRIKMCLIKDSSDTKLV